MTSTARTGRTAIRRPGAGVAIDRGRLVRMRQARLLSRAQLAEAMSDDCTHLAPGCECWSITPDAIAKIENGWRRPKTTTLARMCRALDCEADDLLPATVATAVAACPKCHARFGHEPGCEDAT